MRSTLPEEVSRAKTITRDRELVLRAAQEKAETIVAQAATRHEELLDDHEILQRARTTAEVVLREAEERAACALQAAEYEADERLRRAHA